MIPHGSAADAKAGGSLFRSAFLLVLVLFPPALPFAPLLGLRSPKVSRTDLFWLAAVVLVVIPSVATGSVRPELSLFLLAFLSHKGGQGLAGTGTGARNGPRVGGVFTIALGALLAFTVIQVFFAGAERASGPPWFDHPNQFAFVVLVVGFAAATAQRGGLRFALLVGALVGLVFTGSRSALLAYLLALAVTAGIDRRWRRPVVATIGVAATAVLLASIAFPASTWAQRILSPVVSTLGFERTSKNVLVWTEAMDDAARWNRLGVEVDRVATSSSGTSVWRITRNEPIAWARPQQSVTLHGGREYTLSAALRVPSTAERRALDGSIPGFIAWTSRGESRVTFEVGLQANEAKILRSTGLVRASASVSDLGDGWRRLRFTFTLTGDDNVPLAIGVSPGLASEELRDVVDVKELQLEVAAIPTAYVPAINRATGTGEALARGEIFELAWQGVRSAPIFGHGSTSFADYYAASGGAGQPASHAHNVVLQVAFQSGVFGVLALIAVLAVFYGRARPPQRALLIGLFVGNLFDSTLTAGTVLYLTAFVTPLRLDCDVLTTS